MLRDGALVLLAQALATAIALGVDVLLFRTLPLSERGVLSAALSLRNVLLYVADLGIAFATVRVASDFLAAGKTESAFATFRRAIRTRLVLVLVVAAACAILAPLLAAFPLAANHRNALVWACAAGLFGMTLTSWGVDVSQSSRRFGFYLTHQLAEAVARACAAAAIVLGTTAELAAEPILWSLAVGALIAGVFSTLLHRSVLADPVSDTATTEAHERLKSFGKIAVLVALLQTIGGQIEIFLVQAQLTSQHTAYYDGARRLAMILPLLGGAVVTILLPRAAALQPGEACRVYVRRTLMYCVPLALLAAGILALLADKVIPLFWGSRYDASILPLRWLCAAYGLSIVLQPLLLIFLPLKREGTLLVLHALNLVISILAGVLLIPSHGILGAAWAALIARGAVLLLTFALLPFMLRDPLPASGAGSGAV